MPAVTSCKRRHVSRAGRVPAEVGVANVPGVPGTAQDKSVCKEPVGAVDELAKENSEEEDAGHHGLQRTTETV
jgi:hypothetical protein